MCRVGAVVGSAYIPLSAKSHGDRQLGGDNDHNDDSHETSRVVTSLSVRGEGGEGNRCAAEATFEFFLLIVAPQPLPSHHLIMGTVAGRSVFRNGSHSLARPAVTTSFTPSRLPKFVSAHDTFKPSLRTSSTMHDNDPEVLEREKRRNLSRHPYDQTSSPFDHSPGWNELLASTSEANVKADQDTTPRHDLASRTVAHLKAKVSADENLASVTARFDRDEVTGPLKSARGTDGVVDIDDSFEEEIKEQEGAWTHKVKREQAQNVKSRES
ncbi:hypothetical protein F5148DRAFT_1146401 [Russula earlei]|uniref:Uncharacterized protein n=1 Tax=Russula earlei TaxID=71964 RepID=A0ACC0ULX1_9AGAM|nr:hypothetical protein F5148DRAFT_1146401 [Russula earlei]